MDIINYLASLQINWLLKGQFLLIGLLITGAVTSQWGKPLKIRAANWATIAFVLGCLLIVVLTYNSTRSQGTKGYEIYILVNTHFIRFVIYDLLLFILTRRLIKTCKAERVRKLRFDVLQANRKRRLTHD